ncbi:hypothetical protein RM531_05610 [Salinisphaera sp. P385]|uniref:Yip1 domain-containing protein n=1 Tax=Spectribacter acetivorans TaxID=3075603 RepID=A0ABU3BAD3_9GAMM|nr:hypothetical protein [Salinisphaera sp. P385]MDT0617941.1 hypothetical protein [Salinisphaera sp. P385]
MFVQTLRVTLDILLLRRGPQDLPADWNLLSLVAGAYLTVTFAQVSVAASVGPALVQALLATGLLALYVHGVLKFRDLSPRFLQTLIAFFATGTALTILMLGPTSALAPMLTALAEGASPDDIPQPSTLVLLVYMIVGIWGLIAFGHIYRHALDLSLGFGVLVALGFEMLLFMAFALIGPALR